MMAVFIVSKKMADGHKIEVDDVIPRPDSVIVNCKLRDRVDVRRPVRSGEG